MDQQQKVYLVPTPYMDSRRPHRHRATSASCESENISSVRGQEIAITISAVVAACPPHDKDILELIINADKTLYVAKREDRDRVKEFQDF